MLSVLSKRMYSNGKSWIMEPYIVTLMVRRSKFFMYPEAGVMQLDPLNSVKC